MLTRYKKVLVIMMVVVLSGVFLGSQVLAQEKVEIHVLIRTGAESNAMEMVANAWNKLHAARTGITVKVDKLGVEGYLTRVVTVALGRSPQYDTFFVLANYVGELASAGVIEDLDKYYADKILYPYDPEVVGWLPAALEAMKYKGVTYAIPNAVSTMMLYYRTDLIEDPNLLRTWPGFLQLAQQFTKSINPSSPTEFGTVMQARPGECMPKEWYIYFWSFGGEFFGPNWKPQFNSTAAKEALRFKIDLLRKNHVVPPDVTTYEYMEVLTALAEGKVAFGIEWDAAVPRLQEMTGGKIAVMETPYMPGHKPAAFTHYWTMAISKYSEHKKETFQFLSWVFNDPEGQEWFFKSREVGPVPNKSSLLNPDLLASYPHWEFIANFMGKYGKAEPTIPEWPQIHDTINAHFSRAFAGEITPEEACEIVNAEVDKIMKKGGYY